MSDEPVLRDQFYNGNVKTERGAAIHAEHDKTCISATFNMFQ